MDDKYRKKPVEIQAWQYVYPGGVVELTIRYPQWVLEAYAKGVLRSKVDGDTEVLICKSDTHGDIIANSTDWIIRGVEGEIYPCKDSVFQRTYDKV